ncbi:Zinc finger, RING-type [Dillenia turbinata]|uniref:Zinc finger, RING-type n=1 Tax=Dillenia turbinata TaxID=194707 RepID=A0AAN8VEZ0_9MAGN
MGRELLSDSRECASQLSLNQMNGSSSRQMEVHYINTGFPYTVTESFMDFFEGLSHLPVNYAHLPPIHDQESMYWSMNSNSFKFGYPSLGSTSYYSSYEVNDHLPRMEVSRRAWDYPLTMQIEEPTTVEMQSGENAVTGVDPIPEECIPSSQSSNTSQVLWQDNIDPDNMTYEELLDLGEAVGSQGRGLSPELISLLPTSRYKSGGFFSRKRSKERCVICQMRYKRGHKQIILPCKHVYHTDCGSKWLSINKTCPVCNLET